MLQDTSKHLTSCVPDAEEPGTVPTEPEVVNLSKHELKMEDRKKREDIIKLLNYILNNTTAKPFRWFGGNYMCFFCGKYFPHSLTLKEHMIEEHSEDGWKRLIKTLIGSKISGVKLDISELTCNLCSNSFQTLKDFLNHASDLHKFKFDEELKNSIYAFKLSDDEMFCLDCHKKFTYFGPLLRHVHQAHRNSHPFLCEMCGQGFVSKSNIDGHIRAVHCKGNSTKKSLKRSYKCSKCSESFASRYLRKRHLAFVHDLKSAQFTCSDCDRVFTLKNQLQLHRSRVHMKERNISCDICGFKVFNKDHLKRHMVSHDDSRPFECEFCKKSFQRKKTLDYHRRIHLKDKRYVCRECGSAFVQHTSWKFHCKLHHAIANPTWSKLNEVKK